MPLDKNGHELPDPTPIAIPAGLKRPESLHEQMRRLIRNEYSLKAQENGYESFEDADDFEIGDDFDPASPYEENFDHQVNLNALKAEVENNKNNKNKKPERNASGVSTKKAASKDKVVETHSLESPDSEE